MHVEVGLNDARLCVAARHGPSSLMVCCLTALGTARAVGFLRGRRQLLVFFFMPSVWYCSTAGAEGSHTGQRSQVRHGQRLDTLQFNTSCTDH